MARTQILRTLPSAVEAFHDLTEFSKGGSKQLALLNTVRKTAKQLKRRESQPFYSMREIADHFHVPLRTVALVYQELEREGLLSCIRGSHTLLTGKTLTPRSQVKAVVGIPIWLHALIVSPYARIINMEFEERLRENGFVADIIFFRNEETNGPEFIQRLLDHNLDQVIWHTPHPTLLNTLLSLKDRGVRQIAIQHTESRLSIPIPTYLQDWQPAYFQMAQAWQKEGIQRVILPNPVHLASKRAVKGFQNILLRHGLEVELVEGKAHQLKEKVVAANHKKLSCAVAFIDQQGAEAICNEEPTIIEEILQISRVAFCRGPIRLSYFEHRSAKVDLVRFSPIEAAERVVSDLVKGHTASQGIIHTFLAKYEPQVAFSKQAELL
jgi:hypothetical protein